MSWFTEKGGMLRIEQFQMSQVLMHQLPWMREKVSNSKCQFFHFRLKQNKQKWPKILDPLKDHVTWCEESEL